VRVTTAVRPTLWDRVGRIGPGVVDAVVLVGMGLCVVVDVYSLVNDDPAGLRLIASVGSLVAVALRRRYPVLSYAAVLGIIVALLVTRRSHGLALGYGYPVVAPIAALGAMVTSLVRKLPTPSAVAAGVAGAGGVLLMLSWPMGDQERLLLGVAFGGIYVTGVGAGVYLRALDRRGDLAANAARRDERLEIARELHDLVAHHITGIVVQAQAAQVVADRDPNAAGTALVRIEGAGKEALDAMRRLVGSLREEGADGAAPVAPPVGLAGLDELVAVSQDTGLRVQLHVDEAARQAASTTVAASAHRIVQESLTNVRRHAVDATGVVVDVRRHGSDLVVTVTDDGRQPVGGPHADRPGYGLVGMTERAHALGGELVAGPVAPPAHGWSVQARLPLVGDAP
jgi:signal transduction histidine kinase